LIQSRADLEQRERNSLAPFAALSSLSRGRKWPQKEHTLRPAFQRDRDRIIHSAAFRRMEYKTQVFGSYDKDHFRTRLTHTIEVAQISRTFARSLRLNEDLAAAVALAHDLGHTPFGHAGEDVLDELLKEFGGFNHNRQSLRIVDLLEERYPHHPGLNLTYEVREGIVKHETKVKIKHPDFEDGPLPTLEASLVDVADEIAYNAHDVDDGVSSELLELADLVNCDFFDQVCAISSEDIQRIPGELRRHATIRAMIDSMATDVLEETCRRLTEAGVESLDDVRACDHKLVAYSESMSESVKALKRFLMENLYRHPRLEAQTRVAQEMLAQIFEKLLEDPGKLPERFSARLSGEEPELVVADYVAGMTDRFAVRMASAL